MSATTLIILISIGIFAGVISGMIGIGGGLIMVPFLVFASLAFDKASFELTEATPVSDVVESQFGYHIIKLVAIETNEMLPIESLIKSYRYIKKK